MAAPSDKVLRDTDVHIAERLRNCFERHDVLAMNFVGVPGAGKTCLIEETLERLPEHESAHVLVADLATEMDMARLLAQGYPVSEITTDGSYRVTAKMVARRICPECMHLEDGCSPSFDYLLVENVNCMCKTADLGETARVMVMSVVDGDDKPIKFGDAIAEADAVVWTQADLIPHLSFDLATARANARKYHPGIPMFVVSCTTGEGLGEWMEWIAERMASVRSKEGHRSGRTRPVC